MLSFILGIIGITLAATALAFYAVERIKEDVRKDKRRDHRVYPFKRLPADQKVRYYALAIGGALLCSILAGLGYLGFPRFIGIIFSVIPVIASLYFILLLRRGVREARTTTQTNAFLIFGLIAAIIFVYSFSTLFQGLSWGWAGTFVGLLIGGVALLAIWANHPNENRHRPARRDRYDELDDTDDDEEEEEEEYYDDEDE